MNDMADLESQLRLFTAPASPKLVEELGAGKLRCLACGHRCLVVPGKRGICKVRRNEGGVLRVPHGYVAGLAVDPIEKKPFYHVLPGCSALSFGMLGCDLHCPYCQNWLSSQTLRDEASGGRIERITANDIVRIAVDHDAPVVTSTYNEPLITAEWAAEVFDLARDAGLLTSFVSNGNATPEVLDFLAPRLDLMKVDLKSFRQARYRELGGVLAHVLSTIEGVLARGLWLEVVTLVVPDFNDSDTELREIATFLARLNPDLPWHVTAFHPDYKMADRKSTPVATLERAAAIGREAGLHHVYPGNIAGRLGDQENTRCPGCDALLIPRTGYRVGPVRVGPDGLCPDCGRRLAGLFSARRQ
jgi:pyruvate formate lyase activating enzyme